MNAVVSRCAPGLFAMVFLCGSVATLGAQDCVALYEFNYDLVSTDNNVESSASALTVPFGNTMFWNGAGNPPPLFCLLPPWRTTTEQSPSNGSQRYIQLTVTPLNGCTFNYDSICFDTIHYSGGTTVDKVAVYSNIDGYATKIAQATNIVNSGLNSVSLDLSGFAPLSGVTGAVKFRLYFWSSSNTVSSGETMLDNLKVKAFVNPPAPIPAKIGDRVWLDANENGEQDPGEASVPGVDVILLDANQQPTGQSTTTDNNGFYEFCVDAGQYFVQWVAPAGFGFTTPDAVGVDGQLDSDANPSTGINTNIITIAAGQIFHNYDAGLVALAPPPAKIGNFTWIDANSDGIQQQGEAGLGGVLVSLYDVNSATPNVAVSTINTDPNGFYQFCVAAGTYRVGFTTPNGYIVTDPSQGNDPELDSDAPLGFLITSPVTVTAGETRNDLDAGFVVCAGTQAVATSLGSSCFQLLDPVLSANQPILGTQVTVHMDSAFPNALLLPFFSFGPVTPFQIGNTGCTVFVDAFNPGNLFMPGSFFTDQNGNWDMTFILPNDPMLAGLEFIFQVRVCAPNGPSGPLSPDWASNGLFIRLGCP